MKLDLEAKEKCVSKISSPDVKHKLDEFCFQTHNTSQEAASAFTAIIIGALKTFYRRKAKTDTQSNRSNKKRVPYSYELQIAKRNFRKSKRHYNQSHDYINRCEIYLRDKKRFRKLLYHVQKTYHEQRLIKLADLEAYDSNSFWSSIQKIISPKETESQCTDLNDWLGHFRNVLNCENTQNIDNQFLAYVSQALPILEGVAGLNVSLNMPVTREELNEGIKKLKTGKSASLDEIPDEVNMGYLCLKNLFSTCLIPWLPSSHSQLCGTRAWSYLYSRRVIDPLQIIIVELLYPVVLVNYIWKSSRNVLTITWLLPVYGVKINVVSKRTTERKTCYLFLIQYTNPTW